MRVERPDSPRAPRFAAPSGRESDEASTPRATRRLAWLLMAVTLLPCGCASVREIAALRHVEFDLERVSDVRVAGIRVHEGSRWTDLTALDVARLGAALASESVPLDLVVHVRAHNPPENTTTARLVDLNWTLFLEEREAVAGHLVAAQSLEPGKTVDVPVPVSLDAVPLVRNSGRDLYDLALALAGAGGSPKQLRVDLEPHIDTMLGRMVYPSRITLRKTVGG